MINDVINVVIYVQQGYMFGEDDRPRKGQREEEEEESIKKIVIPYIFLYHYIFRFNLTILFYSLFYAIVLTK